MIRRITETDIHNALDDMVWRNGGRLIGSDHSISTFKGQPQKLRAMRIKLIKLIRAVAAR